MYNRLSCTTAGMASIGEANTCRHLSGVYPGVCMDGKACWDICRDENTDNIGGGCDDVPARCYCFTNC